MLRKTQNPQNNYMGDQLKLAVSCLLEGRDLAIVKSLININNIYGAMSLDYVDEPKQSQILITKDYYDAGSVYYALNCKTGKRYPIEPSLNPVSVRGLFETLAKDTETLEFSVEPEELSSIHQLILQQFATNTEDKLLIKHPAITLVLDQKSHTVFSTMVLNEEMVEILGHSPVANLQFSFVSSTISDKFCQKMVLEQFMWKLGFCLKERVYDTALTDNANSFKLISWPNFGELPFVNEFIRLSSMLWKRSGSYQDLFENTGYSESVINQFLNATLMAGNVIVSINSDVPFIKKTKQESSFIRSMKRLFTFK